jgi:hypothetical protein
MVRLAARRHLSLRHLGVSGEPSHLGSNAQPGPYGNRSADIASIGGIRVGRTNLHDWAWYVLPILCINGNSWFA